MTVPTLDVRVDWRDDGFNYITNDSFVTDTSGWVVTAGINAAGDSLTRTTGDGVLGGVTTNTCAELLTSSTSGSGANFDFGTRTFTSGRTYRLVAWLKQTAGSTSARLRLGSLGTPADRGDATVTVTASWARYSVDWTPSGTRTDVEAAITNGSGVSIQVRLSLVEVYEAIDDIGAYGANDVMAATWARGANFDGSAESPGTATLRVQNNDQRYSPRYSSGALYGLIVPGRSIWARAVYENVVYGLWYGMIRRYVQDVSERDPKTDLVCEDMLAALAQADVDVATSVSRSIRDLRSAVLVDAGIATAQQSLAYGVESAVPVTGESGSSALSVLASCNESTASIHYIDPHPSSSVLYQYTTRDRMTLASGAVAASYAATIAGGDFAFDGGDTTDELWVNYQRVSPTLASIPVAGVLYTDADVPFTIANGDTRFYTIGYPFITPTVVATGATGATVAAYGDTAIVTFTTGGSTETVTSLVISGYGIQVTTGNAEVATSGDGDRRGDPITGEFLGSPSMAKGLASWIVYRYGTARTRAVLTVENQVTTHLEREIGDRVSVTLDLLSMTDVEHLVRGIATTVSSNGLLWVTSLDIEEMPAAGNWFTVGGTADQGVGGTAILGY